MILPDKDAHDLRRLLLHYFEFACERDPEIRRLSETADPDNFREMRGRLFGSPDLVEACAAEGSGNFSAAERRDIRRFRHAIAGRFMIERFLKAGAIFVSEESPARVFQVSGIRDSVEDILWPREAPLMVQAVLLPFRKWVVHDGMILSYPIHFGSGVRARYKEDYMRAKQNGQIIRAPAADGSWPEPGAPQRRPHRAEEAMAIREATREMQGGSPVQREIFALLRACADLTVAAASEPDELDALYKQAHRVDRAMRKAWRALERAEPED